VSARGGKNIISERGGINIVFGPKYRPLVWSKRLKSLSFLTLWLGEFFPFLSKKTFFLFLLKILLSDKKPFKTHTYTEQNVDGKCVGNKTKY
jgi:hypothetical protein